MIIHEFGTQIPECRAWRTGNLTAESICKINQIYDG